LQVQSEKAMEIKVADVAELVDARDLKSLDGNVVWVRVPPPAPMAVPRRKRIGAQVRELPGSIYRRPDKARRKM
jgi:hypothetical protein